MRITDLDKRIIIEKKKAKDSEDGFTIEVWEKYKEVWASVNNLFGEEFFAAKATNSENTVDFKIRYSKEFEKLNTFDFRIKFKNEIYDIQFIDNIKFENDWIKIKAIRK